MLTRPTLFQRGVTLVELTITLGVVAITFAMGAPHLMAWVQNSQVRTAGESLLSELQAARALALKNNAAVRFQLMSSMDNTCVESKEGTNWIITSNAIDIAGKCNLADPDMLKNIIRYKAGSEATKNVKVNSTESRIVFNGLGQIVFPDLPEVTFDLTNPSGGECEVSGGKSRCLQIRITRAGQARMCDPAVTSKSDPRICTPS